jgi:hypothetical protein
MELYVSIYDTDLVDLKHQLQLWSNCKMNLVPTYIHTYMEF